MASLTQGSIHAASCHFQAMITKGQIELPQFLQPLIHSRSRECKSWRHSRTEINFKDWSVIFAWPRPRFSLLSQQQCLKSWHHIWDFCHQLGSWCTPRIYQHHLPAFNSNQGWQKNLWSKRHKISKALWAISQWLSNEDSCDRRWLSRVFLSFLFLLLLDQVQQKSCHRHH